MVAVGTDVLAKRRDYPEDSFATAAESGSSMYHLEEKLWDRVESPFFGCVSIPPLTESFTWKNRIQISFKSSNLPLPGPNGCISVDEEVN